MNDKVIQGWILKVSRVNSTLDHKIQKHAKLNNISFKDTNTYVKLWRLKAIHGTEIYSEMQGGSSNMDWWNGQKR